MPRETVQPPLDCLLGWPGEGLMSTDTCGYCLVELCFQCSEPNDEHCCCRGTYGRLTLGSLLVGSTNANPEESRGPGRPRIDDGEDMKNPLSAGRRRAGNIMKIPEGYVCEWALLEFAGGGITPIVGCAGNTAADLHHGPDKGTLNNEPGINLHRVCEQCHNRWHELNDDYYGPRPAGNIDYFPKPEFGTCEPHDRITRAESATVFASDRWWGASKSDRPAYRQWRTRVPAGKD